MINFKIEVDMPDFDKIEQEIQCPICSLHTWTTIGTIRKRGWVICRGCHANVNIDDHLGSTDLAIKSMTKVIKGLGK